MRNTFNSKYFLWFNAMNSSYVWFILIFLIHLLFKIQFIPESSYWYDEIISVKAASLDFGHIKHESEWDNNPPFYYYCLSVWIKIFNDSEFVTRLLSVIFTSLAGALLFILTKKYFNLSAAISASLLFISSNFIYYYSYEARAYSLILLLGLTSTYFFFELKNTISKSLIFYLGLFNFLLIYTHYISGIILFIQVVFTLLFLKKKQKLYFSLSLLLTLTFIFLRFTKKQWLLILNFNSPTNKFWLEKSTFLSLKKTFSTFLFSDSFIVPILSIIVLSLCYVLIKQKRDIFYVLYINSIGIGAVFLLYFFGLFTSIFLDRYLIYTLPFIFLSVVIIINYVQKSYFFLGIIIPFCFFQISTINYHIDKNMDYKNTVKFIKKVKSEHDLCIIKSKDMEPLFGYYYLKDYFKTKEFPKSENIIVSTNLQGLNLNEYSKIYVMDTYLKSIEDERQFINNILQIKRQIFQTQFYKGVKITVYK